MKYFQFWSLHANCCSSAKYDCFLQNGEMLVFLLLFPQHTLNRKVYFPVPYGVVSWERKTPITLTITLKSYLYCWQREGTKQRFELQQRRFPTHALHPKPDYAHNDNDNVLDKDDDNHDVLDHDGENDDDVNLEANLRWEKSFLHIRDLPTKKGGQREAEKKILYRFSLTGTPHINS